VTGSRDLRSVEVVRVALTEVTAGRKGPHTLVHGCARGADQIAAMVAGKFRWQVEPHPADWAAPCDESCDHGGRRKRRDGSDYCPAAGHRRNQAMAALGADIVVAFFQNGAGNVGTRDCVGCAQAAGLTVRPVTAP
jgi:hypothetical protein